MQTYPVLFLKHLVHRSSSVQFLVPPYQLPLVLTKHLLERSGVLPAPAGLCPSRREGRGTSWPQELLLLEWKPPLAPEDVHAAMNQDERSAWASLVLPIQCGLLMAGQKGAITPAPAKHGASEGKFWGSWLYLVLSAFGCG